MGNFSATIASKTKKYARAEILPEVVAGDTSAFAREKMALLLERGTFYGLLSVFLLAAIPYGSAQQWWIALVDCLVFVLCSFRIVEAMLRRRWNISGVSMLIPALALCCFALAQIIPMGVLNLSTINANAWRTISADPHETQRFVFRLLACVLAGESLFRYTSTRRRLSALVAAVIGIGVLSAGFGLARQALQSHPGFLLPNLGVGEGYGQFINQNHFALLMEMALGLLVGLIVGQSERRSRVLPYLAIALIVWTALVLTNSRGAMISMLGLILCAVITHLTIRKWRSRKRDGAGSGSWLANYGGSMIMSGALVVALVLITAVAVSWVGGDPAVNRLETVSRELRAGGADHLRRKEIWHATWQLIKAHPLTGIGFGGYETAIPEFNTGYSGNEQLSQAHNDYLEILASGGIIGAVLATWFVIAVIRNVLPQLRSRGFFRYSTCLGAVAGLFAVGIHSFVDFGLHITVNALLFTCLVVIATVNCSSETQRSLGRRRDRLPHDARS
jgi:O-antigen ligase